MGGGAWPFLVGGVICLVNSVNERDLNLLNSYDNIAIKAGSGGELSGAGLHGSFHSKLCLDLLVLLLVELLRGTIRV